MVILYNGNIHAEISELGAEIKRNIKTCTF